MYIGTGSAMPEALSASDAGRWEGGCVSRDDESRPERHSPAFGKQPGASSPQISNRMRVLKRRDNGPELAVRHALHAAGLRYRVTWPVPEQRRRTIDVAFTRARLAVYIDGCFWHGCPIHGTSPKANAAWWAEKIAANRARDRDVAAQLAALGWTVMRFWEHEDPEEVARQIRAHLMTQGA